MVWGSMYTMRQNVDCSNSERDAEPADFWDIFSRDGFRRVFKETTSAVIS